MTTKKLAGAIDQELRRLGNNELGPVSLIVVQYSTVDGVLWAQYSDDHGSGYAPAAKLLEVLQSLPDEHFSKSEGTDFWQGLPDETDTLDALMEKDT